MTAKVKSQRAQVTSEFEKQIVQEKLFLFAIKVENFIWIMDIFLKTETKIPCKN